MGEIFYLEAGEENAGERIDAFLASKLNDVTRSWLQKLIEAGNVSVEGREKLA